MIKGEKIPAIETYRKKSCGSKRKNGKRFAKEFDIDEYLRH